MKRWFGALALLLALAACGGGAERATEVIEEPAPTLAAGGERATEAPPDAATDEPATDQPATDQPAAGPTDEPATDQPAAERATPALPAIDSERTQGLRELGERIEVGGVVYAVTAFERTEQPDQLHKAAAGEIYYALTLRIENLDSAKAVASTRCSQR